jgi:phosphatidate cytidylyltransferase
VTLIAAEFFVGNFVDALQDRRVDTAVLGIIVAVAATFGDLAESLVKRDLGIKDMSNILPGHGGIMDRLDSLLATVSVVWLVLHFLLPAV